MEALRRHTGSGGHQMRHYRSRVARCRDDPATMAQTDCFESGDALLSDV
jgi:hypothetical protein